jgi:YD repeat-containing protein
MVGGTQGQQAHGRGRERQRNRFGCDDADRLVLVTDAELGETSYGYDGNGNRTSMVNPRGKTTTYTYDALNRRTVVTDPLSRRRH